ncbi:MAG: M23 family metallopeptidase [Patescibacteria group bacterium]
MKKVFPILILIVVLALIAGGVYVWSLGQRATERTEEDAGSKEASVVFPIAEYANRRTLNAFGEKSQATLDGYHAGDDIEYTDVDAEVPVYAIADGVVKQNDWVKGYGGVMVVTHTIGGKTITAIYGHLDISSTSLSKGDNVLRGEQVAYLGKGGTSETDGERKHLHFAVYEGEDLRIQGYESTQAALFKWTNPHDFFAQYGLDAKSPSRVYNPQEDLGGDEFAIEFLIPEAWEVEYDDSARILNLFKLEGKGSARERSQILFTYFDASQFLTLSTVTIHEVLGLKIGKENYTAKKYDIEKRQGAPSFQDQPSWREERHIAIDFRKQDGHARYYSIAKNPELDEEIFQRVLASIKIVK